MSQDLIIFVCEHGAAKSILAATHFNKLAGERNLDSRAIARGTNPDPELSSKTVEGLERDGLEPSESAPQKLAPTEIESARRIICFCELPEEYQARVKIEIWDDVPPVSENYEKARDAIVARLHRLMK